MQTSMDIFRKISGYELRIYIYIYIYILALLVSQIIGLLFNSSAVLFFVENIIFVLFFIVKFRNYDFSSELNELLTFNHVKEIILISIALLFVTWGVSIMYLYSGINEYLYITGLNNLYPLYFMNLDFSTIPNFPTGISAFDFPDFSWWSIILFKRVHYFRHFHYSFSSYFISISD